MKTSHRVILGVIAFIMLVISIKFFINFVFSFFEDELAISVSMMSIAICLASGTMAISPDDTIKFAAKLFGIALTVLIILIALFGPISFFFFVFAVIGGYTMATARGWY